MSTLYEYHSDRAVATFYSRFDEDCSFAVGNVTAAQSRAINETIRKMEAAAYQAAIHDMKAGHANMLGAMEQQKWAMVP